MRWLGDTRSRTSPPTPCHPYAQKQANTREPTDQNRYERSVEIGHGDRGGDCESGDPSNERTTAILGREPPYLGQGNSCGPDSEGASDDRSGEEPGLPCCVAKDRTDDGTEACQGPSREERGYGFHVALLGEVVCSPRRP